MAGVGGVVPSGPNQDDSAAWQQLLDFVGGDGPAYQRIHERLVRFFDWKGHTDATTLADATFDRVAKRLAEAAQVETPEPVRYVLGVARFIHLETVKRERRDREALNRPDGALPTTADRVEESARMAALQHCLGELYGAEKRLILAYHCGQGQTRIAARKTLATELGVNPNTLRIRAHRIRMRLETCTKTQFAHN
ncbi:MAG: DNA-directed RNA polymerase specialized sigma24 family protein [Myxococcota bacterium]